MQNHFDLFQLPTRFDLNITQLDAAFREIQTRVHPDKFVQASNMEQRIAMQWATHVNEAYQTLKNPLLRACYLCELQGIDLQAESNTAMPMDFLMQQMTWREELEQAENNADALLRLETELQQAQQKQLQQLAEQFAQSDYHQAAQLVRQLMFLEKLRADLDRALILGSWQE
jgi:molecular chaperone HscB